VQAGIQASEERLFSNGIRIYPTSDVVPPLRPGLLRPGLSPQLKSRPRKMDVGGASTISTLDIISPYFALENARVIVPEVWHVPCVGWRCDRDKKFMLKISIIESASQCRLVLEGKLIAPWAGELRAACESARTDLHNRELVIDLKNVTTISGEGEKLLAMLMNEGVKLRASGIFARHVLKQLARRARRGIQEATK
jgi:anti-anti-sigma regulatory factor